MRAEVLVVGLRAEPGPLRCRGKTLVPCMGDEPSHWQDPTRVRSWLPRGGLASPLFGLPLLRAGAARDGRPQLHLFSVLAVDAVCWR